MGLKRFLEKAGVELTHDKGLVLCLQESVLTIVSAYPKISKLSSFSSTVPQKSLLPRHQLELFFLVFCLFSISKENGDWSLWQQRLLQINSEFHQMFSLTAQFCLLICLAFTTTLITQLLTIPSCCPRG